MIEDQHQTKAEMDEVITSHLLKACSLQEVEDFKEWTEENNWHLYWNDNWLNPTRRVTVSIDRLYAMYKNILRSV